MSSNCAAACFAPHNDFRISKARWLMPFFTSQRGLSGRIMPARRNTSDGAETAVNIHRQPYWPFHDWRTNSGVARSGIFSAISQFAVCPTTIPMKMVSW